MGRWGVRGGPATGRVSAQSEGEERREVGGMSLLFELVLTYAHSTVYDPWCV